jgi:hypothetical protein
VSVAVAKPMPQFTFDGSVESPSAALRFILALLNSRGARRGSRFNRVNHCSVLLCMPRSSRCARLVPPVAGGLFTVPSTLATVYEIITLTSEDSRHGP